jgi:hypothetical protein
MGYLCKDNLIYILGGAYLQGNLNSLAVIDLNIRELRVSPLSKNHSIPIERGGHAMEVYNDELYLVGGKDTQGNL